MKRFASRQQAVLVVVIWGGHVRQIRTVRAGRTFGFGDLAGDFPLPRLLRERTAPVIAFRGRTPRLVIPRGAQGWIRLGDGRPRALDELAPGGQAFRSAAAPVFPAESEVALETGSVARLELGFLTLLISRTSLAVPLVRVWRPWLGLDRKLATSCGAVAVTLLGVLSAAAHVVPPLGGSSMDELEPSERIYSVVVALDAEAEPNMAVEPGIGDPDEVPLASPGEMVCKCSHDRNMGDSQVPEPDGRYGVRGPADNPDPHIARAEGEGDLGMSVLPFVPSSHGFFPLGEGPTAPWGRDDSLGTDALSARGHLWGEQIRDAEGQRGMGSRWPSGGLGKVIESESALPRSDGAKRPPRVVHTGLRVAGPVRPSVILPAMATRFGRFRSCYESALERAPELSGQVELAFRIDPSGAASDVQVANADAEDPRLSRCLESAIEGLSFVSAGRGPTEVTYPLLLQPDRAATRPAGSPSSR